MSKIINFGEQVEGYNIPVLNEREIRAGAGLFFVLMFTAILKVIFTGDFTLLKYAIVIFVGDFLVRVLINPKYAPSLIMGRWIVRNQLPEYVGAKQKKFAWIIGIILGLIMLALQVIVNSFSPITGLICFICLIFLLWESAFGICIGCLFYKWVYKDKAQYCPGEVCEVKDRHEIQKMSISHFFIVLAFIAYIFLSVQLFHNFFSVQPEALFGVGEEIHNAESD